MVYLIHFARKLKRAQHYLGYTSLPMEERLKRHQDNRGAAILRACQREGIGYRVVRTWPGQNRDFERKLKNRKQASELCPICNKVSLVLADIPTTVSPFAE